MADMGDPTMWWVETDQGNAAAMNGDAVVLCPDCTSLAERLATAEARVAELEAEIASMRAGWIPVKDGVPYLGAVALVVIPGNDVEPGAHIGIACHYGRGLWKVLGGNIVKATHWMALPEPPKEDAHG